ncbi:MAG: phosphoglucosamine mutase [Holophagaceae bacterium]|uniref:Phosphoglucosamine mutase n=1 Tax=Candidatus Geothrix skivensis TaxID=2954439 RepID=A0A9D7XKU3_9BACT|nr:phosphoglucosamine mutase [Candidatus Geothrix skivensis]
MSLRYFGTDGIRGVALRSPLTLEEVARWGAAWGQVALQAGVKRLVVGWDPRSSSGPMSEAFILGVGMGLKVLVLGMVPTPAVAWNVARLSAEGSKTWGLMISASHNPPEDNGLKGFNELGEKLEEDQERAIEEAFGELSEPTTISAPPAGLELQSYLDHLHGITLPPDFRVVIDCAHGATAEAALELFRGGEIHWIGVPADGPRINVGVGSTHLDALAAAVVAWGAQLGIAFDGDGDRCLLVDATGQVVDGDQMVWLMAQDRVACGDPPPGVVGTLMTNGGLAQALGQAGIPFVRTAVGDKYLLREMARRGWDLAAEASGHLIQKRVGPSGDGLAAALSILRALLHRSPDQRWAWTFRPWPQRLVNVMARDRKTVEACTGLVAAMADIDARWGSGVRQVVRWSGTEPKLRLMVEAQETAWVDEALKDLEAAARRDLSL